MEKIKVLSSKETALKDGKEINFYRYYTYVNIEVFDKDGVSMGVQKKSLSVHFRKDATRQLLKFTDKERLFAIIGGDIDLPSVYRIKVNEDGEEVYPECWVRSVEEFKEIPPKKRESTCKPILDEEDTEPVEIIG